MTFIGCLPFQTQILLALSTAKAENSLIHSWKDFSWPFSEDSIHRKMLNTTSTEETQPMISCPSKTKGGNFGYWSSPKAVLTIGLCFCMLRKQEHCQQTTDSSSAGNSPAAWEGTWNSISKWLCSPLLMFMASVIYKQRNIIHIYMCTSNCVF